jgi:hypothetical protein
MGEMKKLETIMQILVAVQAFLDILNKVGVLPQ